MAVASRAKRYSLKFGQIGAVGHSSAGVKDPKAIGFRRVPIDDLDRRPSPLPHADARRARELDLPAGAFDFDARPGFGNARPVRAVRTQHIGEDGDRVIALEGDEGGRFA